MCRIYWGIIRVYLDITDQLLVVCSALVKYPRKMGMQLDGASAIYRLQEGL